MTDERCRGVTRRVGTATRRGLMIPSIMGVAGAFLGRVGLTEVGAAKRRCPGCRKCGQRCCRAGQACRGGRCVTPCAGEQCGAFPATCPLLPDNNIWNTRVDTLPVHARSDDYLAAIGADAGLHPDFGSGRVQGKPIGIPFTVVPGSQPLVPIQFTDFADESDPGPYPIPPEAAIEGGVCGSSDRHVLVVDRDNCRFFELYQAAPLSGGGWRAKSGASFDLRSNDLRRDTWTSADAAGLPIFPGLVRFDEVAAGLISHALRFTAPDTRDRHVWPARHDASSDDDPALPPMGQRFRLRGDFPLSGFSPTNRVILSALKQYGLMLADNGGPWFLSGTPDERWDNDDLHELQSNVHGRDFEAVDVSSLMVDPNSGRVS